MRISLKVIFLFLLFILSVLLAVSLGSADIPLDELFTITNRQILLLRLSRIVLGIIAGCGLAVAGIALQAILRNPLAEPYLLGTSSGAGLGAVIAIICGVYSVYLIPLASFCGAILSIILVYNLARQGNKVGVQSLILSGVIVSISLSSIIVFLISISTSQALHGAIWWLWGSLQVYNFKLLLVVSSVVALGVFIIFVLAQDLNAISIGEEAAIHLGINTEVTKKVLFLITSLITASLVCICGIIGFVGLIIPHTMRLLVGPNHKILIPTSCLGAATFMVLCDVLSRTIMSPLEVPIGVITAIVGSPIFIILLKSKQKVL